MKMRRTLGLVAAWTTAVLIFSVAPAVAAEGEALLVVKAASLERYLEDGEYFDSLLPAAEPFADRFGRTFVQLLTGVKDVRVTELEGIATDQPLGAALVGAVGARRLVGMVPVSDEAAFVASLAKPLGEAREDGDIYYFETEPGAVYLAIANGWATMSFDRSAVEGALPAESVLAMATAEGDLSVEVRLADASDAERGLLVAPFEAALGAELSAGGSESEAAFAFRRAMAGLELTAVKHVIEGAARISVGITIEDETEAYQSRIVIEPKADTTLARHVANLGSEPSELGAMIVEDAALAMHVNLSLDEETADAFSGAMDAYRDAAKASVSASEQITGEGIDAEGVRTNLSTAVETFVSVMQSSVKAGRLNMAVQMTGDEPGARTLVGGIRIVDGGQLQPLLDQFLEWAKSDRGYGNFELAAGSAGGVPIHAVTVQNSGFEEMLNEWFGTTRLEFAFSEDRLWAAIGPEARAKLVEAMEAAGGLATPLFMTIESGDWPAMLSNSIDDQTLQLAMGLIGTHLRNGDDRVTMRGENIDGNLVIDMTMGDGVMRAGTFVFGLVGQGIADGSLFRSGLFGN